MKNIVPARWTDDCQGKKDYDGQFIGVSTRYWPRGGSATIFNPETRTFSDRFDPSRQDEKPSATSSIVLWSGDPGEEGYDEEYINLVEKDFEGETEEEVKAKVEKWVANEYTKIVTAVKGIYTK